MEVQLSRLEKIAKSIIQHYNHERYWKYRQKVVTPNWGTTVGNIFRLIYIKKADAFNNASMGTHINYGANFASPPQLPHGLNGIIVSHNATIGENCRIYHQVTIGEGHGGAPIIGKNVLLGAGCKIIGKVHIGDCTKISAGCIIMQDIPANAVVFPGESSIIIK